LSKEKLSDSTWRKLTGLSDESTQIVDNMTNSCVGEKHATSAQDVTHGLGKHTSKESSKPELAMNEHRRSILEALARSYTQGDTGLSQRWESTGVSSIVKQAHHVATELQNLRREEKPHPPASIDIDRLKKITSLLQQISGMEVSQEQSDLELRKLGERKTKLGAELKQKVLAREVARNEARAREEAIEASKQNNAVQVETQETLEARIGLEARVAECRRDAALARDMVQLTAHIIQLHTAEMHTYSADKERQMLQIIDSITQATDKLLYHEGFLVSGHLHKDTPQGATQALMGLKRWA
jgi:hypothetical protein